MPNRSLLINISGDAAFIDRVVKEQKDASFLLLDIAGVTPPEVNYQRVFARELDEDHQIEKEAIENYVQSIGELSTSRIRGKSIREYAIGSLPVFWVTDIAQKHPFHHWGLSLFFLLQLAEKKEEFFREFDQITIISTLDSQGIQKIISSLRLFQDKDLKIRALKEKSGSGFPGLAKQTLLFLRNYGAALLRKWKSGSGKLEASELIQVSINRNGMKRSPLMPFLNNYLSSKGTLAYINPADAFWGEHGNDNHAKNVLHYMPGPFSALGICMSIWYQFIFLLKKDSKQTDHFLQAAAMREMVTGLQQIELFFYHQWLVNVFAGVVSSTRVFYEDELYKTGRVISHALGQSASPVKSFGYQHGNIALNHTVYWVGKSELRSLSSSGKDELPFPHYFLIWGDHFRKQLLKPGGLDQEKLIVTGSLQHIISRSKWLGSKTAETSKDFTLLWCTTSATLAKFEYSIIVDELRRNPRWKIVVRMHPHLNIRQEMEQMLDTELLPAFSWNNTDGLALQVTNSSLVVCSAHSSVYLDCINLDVPTVRIFTPFMFPDTMGVNSTVLFNVSNAAEFSAAIHKLSDDQLSEGADASDVIYNKDLSKWDSVLAMK
ncbi:hypothetical protein HHL16_01945 [Pseudoflavitalea sp. G-6-1-2]|uniref:hypothetical protein n=1 Tax=Pseudoflavitalea sp. G-6-1-2 TaxID=2728841 RepID=UPI00146DCBDF|nr:hypothetical protein [Pseudoflavitalea sp. G-6-1-2]NML19612.1 hypothetical protein [Pseudoflavitalea sp. G-6-1-2]